MKKPSIEEEAEEMELMDMLPMDMEIIDEIATASKEMIPQMNVAVPPAEENKLISDEKMVGVYDEVLENIRQDRAEIDNLKSQFEEMVLNGGDATTASKEALVNLMKMKLDTSDKMSKIADLMTRARGVNTFPKYFAANQNNTINMSSKRALTPHEKRTLIENEVKKQNKEVI